MATDLQAPQQATRHEQFVERQLAKATRRIHTLDVGRAVFWLLAATLSFALAMAALDLALPQGDAVKWLRLTCWGAYLACALCLLGLVAWRLARRINPYYAARQIEESLPDAKNSVVNWLDLRKEKLPPSIKNALGIRAAQDLKGTDPEQVVSAGGSWLLTVVTLALIMGMAALLIKAGPDQFVSLMRRAFLPISTVTVPSPTQITLLSPPKGDAIIAPQQSIAFRATISGVVPRVNTPQSPRLHYRYRDNDPWASLPLEQDVDAAWTTTMHADLVQHGFTYKLSAADAETPEYQVKVVSLPQARRFEVTYHFQPYLRLPDITVKHAVSPRIKAHRGTEVTLVVHANHPVRDGKVELNLGSETTLLPGIIPAVDPQAFSVKFTLEKSGSFRALFTSDAGEENTDRSPYPLEVLTDLGPIVTLTKPGKDITLPANGTLQVEGSATDDFGVKNMTLRMQILKGDTKQPLAPRPYRPGADFRFADGSYPDYLEYKDFVPFDQLKYPSGEAVPLATGTVLQYWLEATDNSEFPTKTGNVGKSHVFHVLIAEPQDDKKQQEERQQASDEQKKHEKDQDKDIKQQEQDRNENRQRTPDERRKERDLNDKTDRLQKEIDQQEKREGKETGKGDPSQKGNETGEGSAKDLSQKEIDDLKQKAKQPGREGDAAAEKLADAADEARDPKVRDAAQKALKESGREQKPAKDLTPEDVKNLKKDLQQKGPQADAAEKKLNRAAEQASDPKTRQAAEKALKDAAKDLTPKDIDELKKKLDQKGPQSGAAEKKLNDAAQEASDPKAREAAGHALKDALKNLTPKDIDNLKKKLEQKGPQADAAEKKLADGAEQASDPKTREAASKALKDAIKNLSPKDIEDLKEKLKQKGLAADAAEKKLNDAAQQGKDQETRDAAEQALKDAAKNLSPKDIADLEKKLKQPGPQADAAEKKLTDAAKEAQDPKARASAAKALKDAVKNLTPKEVEDLQKKFEQNGSGADAAEKKLTDAAKNAQDPKARERAEKALKESPKNATPKDVGDLAEQLKQQGKRAESAEEKLKKAAEQARDPKARDAAKEALKDAIKNLSVKDIADLKDKLKQKGEQADAAEDKLNKAKDEAQDPKAREAAEQALKDALKDLTPKDIDDLKKKLDEAGPLSDAAKRKLSKIADEAKDPDLRKKAQQALENEAPLANDPDLNAARRGGNLQLEELKKKVTPEIFKKAGFTEEEYQQFLKERKAYEDAHSRFDPTAKDDPLTKKGGVSQLPSAQPQLVNPSTNPSRTPLQSGRGQPPPGFREAYQRWTTRPAGSPPEKK